VGSASTEVGHDGPCEVVGGPPDVQADVQAASASSATVVAATRTSLDVM
jgi:hypothetical protein